MPQAIRRGASAEIRVTVTGAAPSGVTNHFRLAKDARPSSAPVVEVDDGAITVEEEDGERTYVVPITPAQTAAIPGAGGWYGEVYYLENGTRNVVWPKLTGADSPVADPADRVHVVDALVLQHD